MIGIFKAVGTILLGVAVVAVVLFVFSPVGDWVCGDTNCSEGEGEMPWAWLGFMGFLFSFIALLFIGLFYVVGQFTKEKAQDVKRSTGIWYVNRQIAKREAAALEDNGNDRNIR